MKCHEDKETASRYLSDLLGAEERAEYERHLTECDECVREMERYRRMGALLRNLPRVVAPAGLHASVMEKISAEKPAERRVAILQSWRFRAVAALLVLAAGVGIIFARHTPTPLIDNGATANKDEVKIVAERSAESPATTDALGNDAVYRYGGASGETYMDDETANFYGNAITTVMDAPGKYDVIYVRNALDRVDYALRNLTIKDLQGLAAPDQKKFAEFLLSNGSPDIQHANIVNASDTVVFVQLAQKRVIANAFEKADKLDEVSTVIKGCVTVPANDAREAHALQYELSNAAPQPPDTEGKALGAAESGAPAPSEAVPETEDSRGAEAVAGEGDEKAADAEAAKATDRIRAPAAAHAPLTTSEAAKAREEEAVGAWARTRDEREKAEAEAKTQDESDGKVFGVESPRRFYRAALDATGNTKYARNGQLQRNINGDKEVALEFKQAIVFYAVSLAGERRALNETEQNDVQLVFNSLPTLENYSVDKSAKTGLNVRLGEDEFLRLLKYLNDMATVKAAIGPLNAELAPAEAVPADKDMRNEAAEDPYAVDVQIIFE